MNEELAGPRWLLLVGSVKGASHIRSGQVNQDSVGYYPATWPSEPMGGPLLMVSISDGHGSYRSFRSHLGSRFAVESAQIAVTRSAEALRGLAASQESNALSQLKREAEEVMPQELYRLWRDRVMEHWRKHRFTPTERKMLKARAGESALKAADAHPHLAYGATLLLLLIVDHALICLQLGDGDMLAISDEGQPYHLVSGDPRLFANDTTSLSNNAAWRDFRVSFHRMTEVPPAMMLLSSDGYANSFETEEAFLSVGPDILKRIQTQGLASVRGQLETWLSETSRQGSGDDISLALVCREDAIRPKQVEVASAGEEARPPGTFTTTPLEQYAGPIE